MMNVLRMDFYRLFKGKSFYIIIMVLLLISGLSPILTNATLHISDNGAASASTAKNSIVIVDDSKLSERNINYSTKTDFICDVFSGNVVAMTMIVFSALYAGAYKRTKYEKNIICAVEKRWYFVVSNSIVCLFVCMLVVLLMLGVSTIMNSIIIPEYSNVPFGSVPKLCLFAISYYSLLVCATYMMSCFIRLCKNHIVGIVLALVYGSGIVYGIINLLLSPFLGTDYKIEQFLPLGMMYSLSVNMPESTFHKAILIALVFGSLAVVIDIIAGGKKDVPC